MFHCVFKKKKKKKKKKKSFIHIKTHRGLSAEYYNTIILYYVQYYNNLHTIKSRKKLKYSNNSKEIYLHLKNKIE